MPRRNRPKRAPRRKVRQVEQPRELSPQQAAHDLVRRRLASPAILGPVHTFTRADDASFGQQHAPPLASGNGSPSADFHPARSNP